jgi:hypothetical protein
MKALRCVGIILTMFRRVLAALVFGNADGKGGFTLVTLPRIVTPYRDCLDGARDCVTYQKLLYAFFWVIPRRLNFICRRFGTHCSIFIGKQASRLFTYLPMRMVQTECSETSAYKIQTASNYSEENI